MEQLDAESWNCTKDKNQEKIERIKKEVEKSSK
jgi:hypothetical protein